MAPPIHPEKHQANEPGHGRTQQATVESPVHVLRLECGRLCDLQHLHQGQVELGCFPQPGGGYRVTGLVDCSTPIDSWY